MNNENYNKHNNIDLETINEIEDNNQTVSYEVSQIKKQNEKLNKIKSFTQGKNLLSSNNYPKPKLAYRNLPSEFKFSLNKNLNNQNNINITNANSVKNSNNIVNNSQRVNKNTINQTLNINNEEDSLFDEKENSFNNKLRKSRSVDKSFNPDISEILPSNKVMAKISYGVKNEENKNDKKDTKSELTDRYNENQTNPDDETKSISNHITKEIKPLYSNNHTIYNTPFNNQNLKNIRGSLNNINFQNNSKNDLKSNSNKLVLPNIYQSQKFKQVKISNKEKSIAKIMEKPFPQNQDFLKNENISKVNNKELFKTKLAIIKNDVDETILTLFT
jgi:hypothetical protein